MNTDSPYKQDRDSAVEAEHKDAEHYDKSILALSSGALGISIAFLRFIAPDPVAGSGSYLIAAWAMFLLSITSTLSSMLTSQSGFQRLREIFDLRDAGTPDKYELNLYGSATKTLNIASLIFFVLGSGSLAKFSYINMGIS